MKPNTLPGAALDRSRTHPEDARVNRRILATCLLLIPCAACRDLSAQRPPDTRYEMIRPELGGQGPSHSREWFRFSAGFLDRMQEAGDPIDDGFSFGLDGGFDIATTVLTPSVEVGIAYTSAHVDQVGASSLDLWRGSIGLRGTLYADGGRWRPYVRGGGFVRWSTDDLDEPLDPYATGFYAGAGIDWPYLDGMWLGPSVTWYRGAHEDDVEEWLFALSATFRL